MLVGGLVLTFVASLIGTLVVLIDGEAPGVLNVNCVLVSERLGAHVNCTSMSRCDVVCCVVFFFADDNRGVCDDGMFPPEGKWGVRNGGMFMHVLGEFLLG